MKIINVVGARPNFMKIAPLMTAMAQHPDITPLLVHTGQHYDREMSQLFFSDLGLPEPDVNLGIGSGSPAEQLARIILAFEPILQQAAPDLVLVVGDVTSTLACALVANKCGVPVAHVEAGLRSRDRSMPEEINRLLTDQLADFLFTTSRRAGENLQQEGIPPERIFFVGNVMVDTLLNNRTRAAQSDILTRYHLPPDQYMVLTLHRPGNVDTPDTLAGILDALAAIQQHMPLVFPLHPRTRARLETFGLLQRLEGLPGLILTPPLGYLDFLHLLSHAYLVLSDSGGIQEETTVLGIPCLTLRPNTERPVTIEQGTNTLVGNVPADIIRHVEALLQAPIPGGRIPELWDGHAAERIVDILVTKLGQG